VAVRRLALASLTLDGIGDACGLAERIREQQGDGFLAGSLSGESQIEMIRILLVAHQRVAAAGAGAA